MSFHHDNDSDDRQQARALRIIAWLALGVMFLIPGSIVAWKVAMAW